MTETSEEVGANQALGYIGTKAICHERACACGTTLRLGGRLHTRSPTWDKVRKGLHRHAAAAGWGVANGADVCADCAARDVAP